MNTTPCICNIRKHLYICIGILQYFPIFTKQVMQSLTQ